MRRQKKSDTIKAAASGAGSIHHLNLLAVEDGSGAEFNFIPYKVSAPSQIAARFVTEAKADAVKFETTHNHIGKTKAVVEMGIPCVGHVGLHPQAVGTLGGLKTQGRDIASERKVVSEALALQDAGVFAIIFEAVPAKLSDYVTKKLDIPTISIGSGPECSGQLLVTPDILGLYENSTAAFAKQYVTVGKIMTDAFEGYAKEVKTGIFPGEKHSYGMSHEALASIVREFGYI